MLSRNGTGPAPGGSESGEEPDPRGVQSWCGVQAAAVPAAAVPASVAHGHTGGMGEVRTVRRDRQGLSLVSVRMERRRLLLS